MFHIRVSFLTSPFVPNAQIELEKNQLMERVAYLEKLDEPDTMDNQGRISSFAYYNDTDLSYLDENYGGAGDDDEYGDLDPE